MFQQDQDPEAEEAFAGTFALAGSKQMELRYGENPHQKAAFYRTEPQSEPCAAHAEVLNGKALSYNNLVDLDAAHALAAEFEGPFVSVIKHTNPCGAAEGASISEALELAWSGDPISAFGSVLAFTRPLDLASATFLVEGNRFVEAIIAPDFDDDAHAKAEVGQERQAPGLRSVWSLVPGGRPVRGEEARGRLPRPGP